MVTMLFLAVYWVAEWLDLA